MSADVLVEELHQLARVEAVLLAQVDEQLAVALAGGCGLLPTPSLLTPQLLTPQLLTPSLLTTYHPNFRGVGIVGQELAELQGHDFLDEVVLVHELEVPADVLHEGCNLLLVHVGLDNLVHDLV